MVEFSSVHITMTHHDEFIVLIIMQERGILFVVDVGVFPKS